MKFKASISQVLLMAANAVSASKPVGMGMLHYKEGDYKPEDIQMQSDGVHLDYVEGRMVKLYIHKMDEEQWEVTDSEPRHDYQSWASAYPTYTALLESAGITPQ